MSDTQTPVQTLSLIRRQPLESKDGPGGTFRLEGPSSLLLSGSVSLWYTPRSPGVTDYRHD